MVLEKTWDCKKIKSVNPEGNQPWIFTGQTDAEAEIPILWPPDVKSQLTGKDPDAGKDWGQEKRVTENEMVGWYHRLNGREFVQTLECIEGQGSLVCCSPWGHKKLNTAEWLDNNNIGLYCPNIVLSLSTGQGSRAVSLSPQPDKYTSRSLENIQWGFVFDPGNI